MNVFIILLTASAVVGGVITAIWMYAEVRRKSYEEYMKRKRTK